MASQAGRSGWKWREARRVFRKQCEMAQAPCAHPECGLPIDYSLKGKDPWAFSVDHKIPLSKLPPGDRRANAISNFQPMHFRCNARKGNGDRVNKPLSPAPPPVVSKRLW